MLVLELCEFVRVEADGFFFIGIEVLTEGIRQKNRYGGGGDVDEEMVFSSLAASSTGCSKLMLPTFPLKIPFTAVFSWFLTMISGVKVAVVSGNAKTVCTNGSWIVTLPAVVR